MASIVEHVMAVARKGQTLAAADTVLVSDEWAAKLVKTTKAVAEHAAAEFGPHSIHGRTRHNMAHFLLRLGMNLLGQEARTCRFDPGQVRQAVDAVIFGLDAMERLDRPAVADILNTVLADMKSVNAGDSLPALLAEDIAAQLPAADPAGLDAATFLKAFGKLVDSCVYTLMTRERMAKFGNDYARGLEYLRHLGYVQVSTNPVLAAKAFDEDPKLVEEFRAEAKTHPEWAADPKKYGDAMALRATLIALWPNLTVFRPLAVRAKNSDYMVSFQLNPNIADKAAESLADARAAFTQAADFLANYDKALGLAQPGAVRPCVVFKVAGSHTACRTITRELNADGIGTNNTVVYSVAQEVRLILDAFEGKARAARAGKPITRTYETNMGGRFTSHLREVEAEKIVAAAEVEAGRERTISLLATLADAVKVDAATKAKVKMMSLADQAKTVCAFKYLKSLDNPAFLALSDAAGLPTEEVKTLEADLRKAGTLVARRVWGIFYSPANRPKWTAWLVKSFGVTAEQAKTIHESMDVLPASKRIVEDTLHALGYPNMCHTEFPNHSRAVELAARKPDFRLSDFTNSLSAEYPPEVTARLNKLPEFVLGYELTGPLADLIAKEVGIAEAATYGRGGVSEEDWPKFGPVVKTGAEFRDAYDKFAARCVQLVSSNA